MSKQSWIVCVLTLFVYLLLSVLSAEAVVHSYVEDFTTIQYCDMLNTTAWWDTVAGEVKLPPFELTLAGSHDTPDRARGVAISGDYAYVADMISGLQVIDISNPTSPTLAGSYDTPGYAKDVAISGDYAYVGDNVSGGLQVIDISNPASPTLAGSYDTPGWALGVAISGDYAYVADYQYGLQVIDISNPASPTLAGSYNTPGLAQGVAISGDYAYVADYTSGLQVIDITNPASPTLAGSYDTPGEARGVAISGDYAYVADHWLGLKVIDISNPASPTLAGSYDTPDRAWAVAISGDYAYVADEGSGLQVIDIANPASPTLAGTYDTPGYTWAVAISGDYTYVADEGSGLQVIDITNPASPTLAGSYDTPGQAFGVAISGDYAYVADDASGLQVIDITNPASPTLAGSCDTPGQAYGVAISGDYAYVADRGSGLTVIDITNPASPTLAGSYDTPGEAWAVAISGDYAYVGDAASGLQVIDITNPASPTLAGSYDTPGEAWGVAISGDYAYVGDAASGLTVIDITDPTSPTLAGSYDTPGYAYGVAIAGDYAYIADESSGLQVIDIANPASPTLAGSYDTPGYAYGVTISGDYAYVVDGYSGLQVIEVFQRRYDEQSNTAQSLTIDEADEMILKACLNATYSDSIRWELSADSGSSWQEFLPGAAYQAFITPGSDLLWRSAHFYTGGGVNPGCTDLKIEWLYSFAVIDNVVDIPNDQGRQVRITWTRSGYDAPGSSTPITEYAIFRRIDQVLASSLPALGHKGRALKTQRLIEDSQGLITYPPGDWDFLKTVPADCEDSYSTVVPTLADSSISQGMHFTTLFVRARSDTPGVYFDSYPDSGYSVDNLAPAPPPNLRMTTPTELAWDEASEEDFNYFSVYGSSGPDLDTTATLIGYTVGTVMDVSEDVYSHYHVTATDFSGNEGDASSVENEYSGIADTEDLPAGLTLRQNQPNPFEAKTTIRFDLPEPGLVSLTVHDVGGRLVRSLTGRIWVAGRHSVVWTGDDSQGSTVGPGIYFIRMEAGDFTDTKKVMVLR